MLRSLCALVLVALTSGCASIYGQGAAEWPWPTGNPCGGSCDSKDAMTAYVKASEFCRKVQNFYERGGQRSDATRLAVGAVGAVAGSVLAPISHGTAATAWSGLSGAANATQVAMDDAFSSSVAAKRRNKVADALDAGHTAYGSAQDDQGRVLAAVHMATSCSMASARADAQVLQKLAE